jgi:hypothetical protein
LWVNQVKAKLGGFAAGLRPLPTRVLEFDRKFYILMPDLSVGWGTKSAEKQGQPITILKSGEGQECSKIMQEYLRLEVWDRIPDSMIREYLAVLMFRQVLGISDTCNRNVLQRGQEIWSVDECVSGKPLGVVKMKGGGVPSTADFWVAHLAKPLKQQLEAWFKAHRQWCLDLLAQWRAVDLSMCARDLEVRFAAVEAKLNELNQ